MREFCLLLLASFSLAGCSTTQSEAPSTQTLSFANPLKGDAAAQQQSCRDGLVSSFGRYVGSWTFVDSQIDANGQWTDGQGGEWDFYCLGDGLAVIDLWKPQAGGFGSTMRMYDADSSRWDVVFTGEGSQAMSQLTGTEMPDGSIEMHYVRPAFDPARRITFTPPKDGAFKWSLAISRDGKKTWTDVYRMSVKRR